MPFKVLTYTKFFAILGLSLFIFLSALALCPLIGFEKISISKALDSSLPKSMNPDAAILFRVRLPRTLLAALVGAALAASGVAFQAMLKNPLATPYTLGISGGSSLFSVLALLYAEALVIRIPFLQPLASFLGALITLWLVYQLGKRQGILHNVALILAGVTLNLFFSALILLIQFLSDPAQTVLIMHWLMGSLDIDRYSPILILLPFQAIGLAVILFHARDMNALALDEMSARSLGVDVPRVMKRLYAASSLVVGTAIAFSGPIGFIGLIVPHGLRLVLGADHRLLLPVSVLTGGAFLALCDTAARTLIAPAELPVGVITALLGGPFFLALLIKPLNGGAI